MLDFIKTIVETRDELDKKSNEDKNTIKDVMMDRIKMYDDTIIHYYKRIISKRNEGIRKQYAAVIDPVLDVVYPQFLRNLQNNKKI